MNNCQTCPKKTECNRRLIPLEDAVSIVVDGFDQNELEKALEILGQTAVQCDKNLFTSQGEPKTLTDAKSFYSFFSEKKPVIES